MHNICIGGGNLRVFIGSENFALSPLARKVKTASISFSHSEIYV